MLMRLAFATIIVGIISGFLVTIYELLIIFTTHLFFAGDPYKTVSTLPVWYLYTLPTVVIFIVNYLTSRDKNIREYGVSEIANSIMQNKMTIKLKTLFFKIISSTLSLSSGYMVGTEGPSASIGAMVAYHIHKWFKLPSFLIKMLISVGASSGIAAIFVSPLTGISFAIEQIAYQFLKRYISYLIVASVIAFSISVNFLEPIIFKYSHGKDINLKLLLYDFAFIPYITLFIYIYLFLKKRVLHFIDLEVFKNIAKYRNLIFSIIGGAVVGTSLLIEPHAAFSGKDVVIYLINHNNHIPLLLIFAILILRIIGTTVSIYSNAVGGLFLPLMSIGALVGYSFAEILNYFHFTSEGFYFAAIGASVFMGVIMKLPLTALILSLETTFDYNVIVATGIILFFVDRLSGIFFDIQRKYITKEDKIEKSE